MMERSFMGENWKSKDLREFVPVLRKYDYHYSHASGSHFIFVNHKTHKHKSVPKNLNKMIRQRLEKELKREEEV